MATPEGRVKDGVKMVLAKYKVYYHCPVQNGMGAPSLDFIGCHVGHYFGIETKAPGKRPTPRQLITMANITRCGGKIFVIDGTDKTDTYNDLDEWISDLIKEWLAFECVTHLITLLIRLPVVENPTCMLCSYYSSSAVQ